MHTNEANTVQPFLAAITIMGSGRLGPTLTALIGLAGTVLGWRALAHARRRTSVGADSGRSDATAALVLGAISVVLGGVFLAAADGGPGTGDGVVGSFVAIVLGPVAMGLGGFARARRGAGPVSRDQLASATAGEPRGHGTESR